MKNLRTTLAEVAAECGVTKMTASRALREGTVVAGETRARVREAAERLGYRPDPFLAGLAEHKRRKAGPEKKATLAYVTQYGAGTNFERWRDWPVYRSFFAGAKRRAEALGYGLEEFSVPGAGSRARAEQVLANRGYAGLLMAPSPLPAGYTRLGLADFPVVALGYSLRRPRLHHAVTNHFQAVQDVMHELKKRGFERVGLAISRERDARAAHRWTASFRSWQESFLPAWRRVPLCLHEEAARDAALPAWFERERPDVLVTVLGWERDVLVRAGWSFPRDAGYAALSLDENEVGVCAGFSEEPLEVGASAVDLLHMLILRNERGVPACPLGLKIDGRWYDGPTLPGG
jgi:DNA-binding LacI/PurR family transcriptional regulator